MQQVKNKILIQSNGDYNATEKRIAACSHNYSIGELDDESLFQYVKALVSGIKNLVGIKEVTQSQMTLFMDFLKKYYKTLSISEIKLAFELSIIGKLDKYLPKNRNGEAERSHYQLFSMEYVSKILNAYKKFRDEVKLKASKQQTALPSGEYQKARENNLDELNKAFETYKNSGEKTHFVIPFVYCSYLQEMGLMETIPEEKQKEDVSKSILRTFLMEGEQEEKESERENAIYEVFDRLIEMGEKLQDYEL